MGSRRTRGFQERMTQGIPATCSGVASTTSSVWSGGSEDGLFSYLWSSSSAAGSAATASSKERVAAPSSAATDVDAASSSSKMDLASLDADLEELLGEGFPKKLAPVLVPTPAVVPVGLSPTTSKLKRISKKSLTTGCGGKDGKPVLTVVAMGNFDGDGTRYDVALKHSKEYALAAMQNTNEVHHVILGNMSPDVYYASGDDDCVKRSVSMAAPSPARVHLMLGYRELSSLRFRERPFKGELKRPPRSETGGWDVAPNELLEMVRTLQRKAPFADSTAAIWDWNAYNKDIELAFGSLDRYKDDEFFYSCTAEQKTALGRALGFGMYLKLESMLARTKDAGPRNANSSTKDEYFKPSVTAPGLAATFAKRLAIDSSVLPLGVGFELNASWARFTKTDDAGFLYLVEEAEKLVDDAVLILESVLDYFTTGPMDEYLSQAKVVQCLGHRDDRIDGEGGMWFMSTGTSNAAIVGKVPVRALPPYKDDRRDYVDVEWMDVEDHVDADGNRYEASLLDWKDAFNKCWTVFYKKLREGTASDSEVELWVALSLPETMYGPAQSYDEVPLWGLRPSTAKSQTMGAVGRLNSMPFGMIRSRLDVDADKALVTTRSVWVTNNTEKFGATTYWTVATWCRTTAMQMTPQSCKLNLGLLHFDYQHDVQLTVHTLLSHKLRDEKPYERMFGTMRGVIGPVVKGSGEGGEWLRAVYWTDKSIKGGLIMLLPEPYVQFMLQNYRRNMSFPEDSPPVACSFGYMVFYNEDAIPIKVPGLTLEEEIATSDAMGLRLWHLCRRGINACDQRDLHHSNATKAMQQSLPVWRDLMRYEVKDRKPVDGMVAGDRIPSGPEETIYYTQQMTNNDPFVGLVVKWVLASAQSNLPTITADNDSGGVQAFFENVF